MNLEKMEKESLERKEFQKRQRVQKQLQENLLLFSVSGAIEFKDETEFKRHCNIILWAKGNKNFPQNSHVKHKNTGYINGTADDICMDKWNGFWMIEYKMPGGKRRPSQIEMQRIMGERYLLVEPKNYREIFKKNKLT